MGKLANQVTNSKGALGISSSSCSQRSNLVSRGDDLEVGWVESPKKLKATLEKENIMEWKDIVDTPPSLSSHSWADEVKAMESQRNAKDTSPIRNASVWDNFDISKISNAGFKLEFISPVKVGD